MARFETRAAETISQTSIEQSLTCGLNLLELSDACRQRTASAGSLEELARDGSLSIDLAPGKNSQPRSLADSFRDSYKLTHNDIYADLYKPMPHVVPRVPDVPALLPLPRPNEPLKPEPLKPLFPLKPEANENGKVIRDGNRLHVEYPGAIKSRDIVFDSSGRAEEITTKDRSGTVQLVRRGEHWLAKIQGMELPLQGRIEADGRGEVTFEIGRGIYSREKPDGTSVQEKLNPDGSRLSLYKNNQVEKLTRKDGSSVQVSLDGKTIVETLAKSRKQITWSKQADKTWVSDSNPAQQRKNFRVEANGCTIWHGRGGLRVVIRGDGTESRQGPSTRLVDSARERLEAQALRSGCSMARVHKYMEDFEARCRHERGRKGRHAPTEAQIAQTYENFSKLLRGRDRPAETYSDRAVFTTPSRPNSRLQTGLNDSARAHVFETGLRNLAYVKEIDQGRNPTCNITTGEIYMASRRPEHYSRICMEVATKGCFTGMSGKTHHLKRAAYMAGRQENEYNPDKGNCDTRNWASKIIQNAGINTDSRWNGRYISGDPVFRVPEIVRATKEMCGDTMPYISTRATKAILRNLERRGAFPCGILVCGGRHVQTIHDVSSDARGGLIALLDDQHGSSKDRGWVTLDELNRRQMGVVSHKPRRPAIYRPRT